MKNLKDTSDIIRKFDEKFGNESADKIKEIIDLSMDRFSDEMNNFRGEMKAFKDAVQNQFTVMMWVMGAGIALIAIIVAFK